MKRTKKYSKFSTLTAAGVFVLMGFLLTGPAMAADNVGTGDIAGDSASLSSSNTFSLFTTTLSLRKTAFLPNGTQLTTGATLPRGTEVAFVIYIDNPTLFPLNDVSVQDGLDAAFDYVPGSMRVDNTLSAGATEAQIFSTLYNAGTVASDTIGNDVASAVGSTIDAGNSVVTTNADLNVAADSVWGILFRVLMQ